MEDRPEAETLTDAAPAGAVVDAVVNGPLQNASPLTDPPGAEAWAVEKSGLVEALPVAEPFWLRPEIVCAVPAVVADPELEADGPDIVAVEPRPEPDAVPVALPDCVEAVTVTKEPLALPLTEATLPADASGADASGLALRSIRHPGYANRPSRTATFSVSS